MAIYVVRPGDSVDTIASRTNTAVESIIWANQIEYPYRLAVGESLYLADNAAKGEYERPPLYSFGYAYPYISREVLRETLPVLTDLYIFSYGFTMEGELVPPAVDDTWMIEEADNAGVGPVLVLTPSGADGHFNNNLVTKLVSDPVVQEHLIWELGRTLLRKGYRGVDIDFEYVQAADREGFAAFVGKVRSVMSLFGYQVTVALAPKTSAGQAGLLYEGMDYGLLGAAADRVMLMTYEWGYTYGPPMAVAPIHMVRRVVEYALTEIPREKISLGIPNYGYDWPLPYVRQVTKAVTLGNLEAVQIAIDHGVDIRFDTLAQSPYFRYWQYGIQHEVWFEDIRSIRAKFDLIREYGLNGAGYWQLMRFFRSNWLLMEELFRIRRRT